MISLEEARQRVSRYLGRADPYQAEEIELVIVETMERPWGWVFFYQSRRYLETGDFSSCLAGNSPIIVDARSGVATVTGTAHPVEHYIAEYERAQGLE